LQNAPYSQTAGYWASQVALTPTASSGSISGRILTSEGAPLGGATINLAGTHIADAITDANGVYSFAGLEIGGLYTVTRRAPTTRSIHPAEVSHCSPM
jgi:hypothetical protein